MSATTSARSIRSIPTNGPTLLSTSHFLPFSDHGDSGAVVVDARGRMGGMVTGGFRYSEKTDIT